MAMLQVKLREMVLEATAATTNFQTDVLETRRTWLPKHQWEQVGNGRER